MRVLLAEDNHLMGSGMQQGMSKAGYAVDWVRTGEEVLPALRSNSYECALIDLGLPGIGGDHVVKMVRAQGLDVSLIVITAQGGIQERVQLLDSGADDYMIKPVDLEELAARVRATLRRRQGQGTVRAEPEHGPLKLYPTRRTATWHESLVPLTSKEFWLLEVFVRRKNEVLSRAQLEEALYRWGNEIDSNAVEVYVHRLRRKFTPALIQTVRGIGYQLANTKQIE